MADKKQKKSMEKMDELRAHTDLKLSLIHI